MSFDDYLKRNGSQASTISINDLRKEINERERVPNPFPLDVFHPNIKPFIQSLNFQYDLPKAYIGLALLSAYSTAIGTAYSVSTNGRDRIFLPVWACMVGISSSGKTLAIDKIFEPLNELQDQFDSEWHLTTHGMSAEKIKFCKMKTIIYREAHIPTLVRWILPDNPKGVLKWNDEMIEWINGMNQLSNKEGTDEQFWISSWNCKNYSGIRSGKQKFVNKRPFVNVAGGMQPTILHKLFAKDRDSTGFVFRLLFAKPEHNRIAEPDGSFLLPSAQYDIHRKSLLRLFGDLPMEWEENEPKHCILTREAIRRYNIWVKEKIRMVNSLDDIMDKEINSGILGKIKEYILRFSAILTLSDKSLDAGYGKSEEMKFQDNEPVTVETMDRAIALGDYFYQAAVEIYEEIQTKITAPPEVFRMAVLMKMGRSYKDIASIEYGDNTEAGKQRVYRTFRRWLKEYPKVFQSSAR